MTRKARGETGRRNLGRHLHKGSSPISTSALAIAAIATIAVGAGVYYHTAHRVVAPQPVAKPASKPMRASPEALEVLAQLRTRYAPVPQRRRRGVVDEPQTNSDPGNPDSDAVAATQASPLLPGLTDDFEANPAGILARFPASSGKPEAKVVLPSRANAAFELQDVGTGMHVQAQLEGAQDKAAEMADGYAVYRQALGPNTTVLRRAMPNGSEDFVSFAEAPNEPSVTYHVGLDSNVAGLRTVGNSLELLDKDGTPRLRVAPPYIVGADGEWLEAKLTLSGCAADVNPTAPWGRTVTASGANSCQLRVSWDNDAVEYPALLDPTWITTTSMSTARQGHTATLLSTGKVLVAGGTNGTAALATAELYDRTTGTWAATNSMTGARQWHTAVQLNTSSNATTSGKVLIAGGRNGTSSLNTAQLYSPTAGTWVAAGNLNAARQQHTATVLPSGKVLVTGGVSGTTVLATAATYDPSSGAGTWTATTGSMPAARKFHAATLISTTNTQLNGKVLVTGGNSGTASQSTVYLYDPAQLAFSTLAAMPTAREGHTATVRSSTKILLAGGKNGATTLNTAIAFDPTTGPGSWSTVGNMTVARQGHSASLLSDGRVLVAGGSNGTTTLSSAELYDGPAGWTATAAMPAAVQAHTATVLGNGIVLVAGGLNGATTQSAARLYDVTGGNTCTSNSQCQSGNCVSGVCCNTTCSDQCYSCSLTGLVGICSPKLNGTTCNDGNTCTQTDTCQAGACAGANPVTCTALDQCHAVGTCNTSTGTCSNPNKANGTACSDGNACTQSDTCQAGNCSSGTPVTCTALDQCHDAGTCDTSTGTCSNPTKADGTACTDSNVCTAGDQCAAGACQAGTPVTTDDGDTCTADSCDPVIGVQHAIDTADPVCVQWNSGGLQLKVLTNSCTANQVIQYLQVTNTGATAVSLSDIAIKFWVNDSSGSNISPQVLSGGCVTNASTYPACGHQVSGVTTGASSFASCSGDATHQVNWEMAVTNTDSTQLAPGQIWNSLQVSTKLANDGNFSPGTSAWYSPCLTGTDYATDNHFGVYYKGNLVFSSGVNAPDCKAPKGADQVLTGHVPAEVATAPLVGPVSPSTIVTLNAGLPVSDPDRLRAFVQQVSDPSSPSYGQYLSQDDFETQYAPNTGDYTKLHDWAVANGLTIRSTDPSRLVMGLSGTAAAISKALYVNLDYYRRPDGTTFFAPDRDPTVQLTTKLLDISGLDSVFVEKPGGISPNGSDSWDAGNGEQYRNLYNNKDLHNAYAGCTTYTGYGQSLATWTDTFGWSKDIGGLNHLGFAKYDEQALKEDVEAYLALSSMTLHTTLKSCNLLNGNGDCSNGTAGLGTLDPTDKSLGAPYPELALDVEMALAMAPGLSEILVFEGGTREDAIVAFTQHRPLIRQLSISYSITGMRSKIIESALHRATAQGQSVFNSTGDNGPYKEAPAEAIPQSSDMNDLMFTAVGGTQLQLTSDKTAWAKEVVWWDPSVDPALPGTGAGTLFYSPRPTYQVGTLNLESQQYRNVPDVSAVALHVSVVVNKVHGWTGGTSAATPLWAGFVALMNQHNAAKGLPPVGFLNPKLYVIGNSAGRDTYFHDITEGATGDSTTTRADGSHYDRIYSASTGFDMASGWGSPKCALIEPPSSAVPVNPKSQELALGQSHSCALRPDGDVACWGANASGQLGTGGTADYAVPVIVTRAWPSTSKVAAVVAGAAHTCALVSAPSGTTTVWCWGANNYGQLGNLGTANTLTPVKVMLTSTSELTNVTSIASGSNHTCAVVSDPSDPNNVALRSAWCWGSNQSGQLGTIVAAPAPLSFNYPVQVKLSSTTNLKNVVAIAGGSQHTCAVVGTQIYCWGSNGSLQLGRLTPSPADALTPMPVVGLPAFVPGGGLGTYTGVGVIAGDNHTCATAEFNAGETYGEKLFRLWCWGSNSNGQLNRPTSIAMSEVPTLISFCGPWTAASAGSNHTCGVLSPTQSCGTGGPAMRSVLCWGDDSSGQLGDNMPTSFSSSPVVAINTRDITAIAAGGSHTCASNQYGLSCWGQNDHGQVGNGTTMVMRVPSTVLFPVVLF
jgi:alpha-tubulin suppressor-like RCC1 family protein